MTALTGSYANHDIGVGAFVPAHANSASQPNGVTAFYQDGRGSLGGAKTENRPVAVITRALTGAIEKTYFFDYYNRVWMIPASVALGAITGDTVYPLKAWNAWSIPNTFTGAVISGSIDGAEISGTPDGTVIPALGIANFALSIAGDGAPSVSGDLLFSFSTETRSVPVTGVRAYLWDYAFWPNWREPVRITYTFKTEIFQSRHMYEQRRALISHPRKKIEFTVSAFDTTHDDKHRQFRRLMQRAQNSSFVMPEWPRRVAITTAVAIGDDSFDVESVPAWLTVGRQVILAYGDTAEVFQVQNVSGLTITLSSQTKSAYPVGAPMIAGLSGFLEDKISGSLRASHVSEHSIVFMSNPGQEPDGAFDLGDEEQIFEGREIMPWRPNWLRDPTLDMIWPSELVDHGFGVIDRFNIQPMPQQMLKATFLAVKAEEAERVLRFFMRAQGMRGEFFVPTFENDLELREPSIAGSNHVRLIGTEPFAAWMVNSTTYSAVVFRMNDGTLVPMRIQNVVEVNDTTGNDTLITFTSNLPVEVGGAEMSTADWLLLCRFASDTMTFGWETIDVAQFDMPFMAMPYQEAE